MAGSRGWKDWLDEYARAHEIKERRTARRLRLTKIVLDFAWRIVHGTMGAIAE